MIKSLLFTILLLNGLTLFGQREQVNPKAIDIDLLGTHLLYYTNYERRKKRVQPLKYYKVLDSAAKDHAYYMAKYAYLSHRQDDLEKKNAKRRVAYYGASAQFVGENILALGINRKIRESKKGITYKDLAKIIIREWKKSDEFYENILSKEFTGVSHQLKYRGGYLFICQVFSSRNFEAKYKYKPAEKIWVFEKKPCKNCYNTIKKIDNDKAHIGWYSVSNDSLFYHNLKYITKSHSFNFWKLHLNWYTKRNNIKSIFKRRADIAVDVIQNEQFDCYGNAGFKGELYCDGYHLGNLNRRLIRLKNLNKTSSLIKVYVAQIPNFNDELYQVDFNYNKRRRPCTNYSIIYLKPDYFLPKDYFKMPKPVMSNDESEIIRNDSIVIPIPFKRNQTDEDKLIFQSLNKVLDSLSKLNIGIDMIWYTGIASIEGSEKINRSLIEKRGELIENEIIKNYPKHKLSKIFYENFSGFRDGLELLGNSTLFKASESELRTYANLNRNESNIKKLLDMTRVSEVTLKYKTSIPKTNEIVFTVKNIKDLMSMHKVNEAQLLYQYLANKALNGTNQKMDSLININIPFATEYGGICWDQFILKLNTPGFMVDSSVLNSLYRINAIKSPSQYLEYKLIFNVFYETNIFYTDSIESRIEEIRSKRLRGWLSVLNQISKIQNYESDITNGCQTIVDLCIKHKFDIYKTYLVSQYLIEWGLYKESIVLLSKFVRQKGHFPKIYQQYLKLANYLGHFEHSKKLNQSVHVMKNLAEVNQIKFCELFTWQQMGVRALDNAKIAELFCNYCRTQ